MVEEKGDNDDDTFQAVEASLKAAREAKALEEKKKEDEAFQAVEATLVAQREAHAKRIAAENSKKRKIATVITKRPAFVTQSSAKAGIAHVTHLK